MVPILEPNDKPIAILLNTYFNEDNEDIEDFEDIDVNDETEHESNEGIDDSVGEDIKSSILIILII